MRFIDPVTDIESPLVTLLHTHHDVSYGSHRCTFVWLLQYSLPSDSTIYWQDGVGYLIGFALVGFYGISTHADYLIPDSIFTYIKTDISKLIFFFYFVSFGLIAYQPL